MFGWYCLVYFEQLCDVTGFDTGYICGQGE